MFWFVAVGLAIAVALVLGGLLRMWEQSRHVRELLRDSLKTRWRQRRHRSR